MRATAYRFMLQQALDDDQLELFYQPILTLTSGATIGLEAHGLTYDADHARIPTMDAK